LNNREKAIRQTKQFLKKNGTIIPIEVRCLIEESIEIQKDLMDIYSEEVKDVLGWND